MATRNDHEPDRLSQASMPLAGALLQLAGQQRSSWHMPAHNAGHDWPAWLRDNLAAMDVTELPGTGDITCPAGPARSAMQMAAKAFGAGETRFITSGSTTAIQIMIAVTVGRGGQLLLSRCVHQSVMHSIALMNIRPIWIEEASPARMDLQFSLLPVPTSAQVSAALVAHPDCRAVLLTAPDYYGYMPDLAAIASAVHACGCILLIDEAHGAHLAFSEQLPQGALAAGADICVQSGHKTLPVLTPGAMLHVSSDAIAAQLVDMERLNILVPVFQTSSPSFTIAATLDYARAWLEQYGRDAIGRQLRFHENFAAGLSPQFKTPSASDADQAIFHDSLRLVLASADPDETLDAPSLSEKMSSSGIDIEFADLTRMILIPSLKQREQQWHLLSDAIRKLAPEAIRRTGSSIIRALEGEWRHFLAAAPRQEMAPGDVLFQKTRRRRVSLMQAAGAISAAPVLPYPPGVPLLWPGELIDDVRVDFLRRLSENNININGIDQGSLLVID